MKGRHCKSPEDVLDSGSEVASCGCGPPQGQWCRAGPTTISSTVAVALPMVRGAELALTPSAPHHPHYRDVRGSLDWEK